MNSAGPSVAAPLEPALASAAKPKPAKVIVAAGIGSAFEVYDFTLFAFFAVTIAPTFFPAADAGASLLLTIATFGIGAVMRPVGALVLGSYADRVGRKTVLTLTLLMMAVASVTIGLTPSYEQIGIWAPIIVVIARMAQGFSIGGEGGSASTFVIEQAPPHRRGLYLGCLSMFSLGATIFSSGIGLALRYLLGEEAMMEWGWRIPFIFGGLVAPVGFYIRRHLPESEMFVQSKAKLEAATGSQAERPKLGLGTLLLIMGGFIPGTVVNYLAMIYMPTYLNSQMGVDLDVVFRGVFFAAAVVGISMPLMGGLSDYTGRRPILLTGGVILLVSSYPLYLLLQGSPSFWTILAVQCSFAVMMAMTTAPMVPLAAEHFPTVRRTLGMSVGSTVPIAIFGTCSPLIVTGLMVYTGTPLAPAFYIMAAAFAGLVAIAFLPERARLLP